MDPSIVIDTEILICYRNLNFLCQKSFFGCLLESINKSDNYPVATPIEHELNQPCGAFQCDLVKEICYLKLLFVLV